jgi:hypothetical protein
MTALLDRALTFPHKQNGSKRMTFIVFSCTDQRIVALVRSMLGSWAAPKRRGLFVLLNTASIITMTLTPIRLKLGVFYHRYRTFLLHLVDCIPTFSLHHLALSLCAGHKLVFPSRPTLSFFSLQAGPQYVNDRNTAHT